MLYLHGIAYGIDIRHRGFHAVIDQDASLYAKLQSGFPGKRCVRRNTDGQDCHVGAYGLFPF